MRAWKKWLISIAACIATTATLAACGGSSGSNDGGSDNNSNNNSITSEQPNDNECTVTFEICSDLKTNKVTPKKVEKGQKITKPVLVVIGENPENAEVVGWYIDSEYTTEWNFDTDTVQGDVTLYAKWSDSYPVVYYLGEETETEFFRELVKEGSLLQRNDALADGYLSRGFFADPEHTIPFDFTQPIVGPTNVYIDRSEQIYFSGDMMARRFTPKAALSAGSTAGTIAAETNDAGETYAKMNFGYSTAMDPHMMLQNVLLDISKSQKLRITFKNLGKAQAMSFYFVVWYADRTPVGGYANFGEKTCVRYHFTEEQKSMDPNGEWATVEIDMAQLSQDSGVSLWGNAASLVQLRFQMAYKSESPDDLSNEIWVKSIEGVSDSTYVGTDDSQEVQDLLIDDDETVTGNVSGAQEQVAGWIFPKNYENVTSVNGSTEVYNKANGLLMYTDYRGAGSIVLTSLGNVNLDELTTLKIRLRNFGYATKLTLKYRNKRGRSENCELTIDSLMGEVAEYKLNLFGANDYEGILDRLTISYESVGNDNALLIESIIFDEFESVQLPGFNFDDKYHNGAVSNAQMEVSYDASSKGTKFNVLESGAAYTKTFDCYSMFGYKALELNYMKAEEGVTALTVDLVIDGEAESYRFELAVGEMAQAISLPLVRTGYLESATFKFEGKGEVVIKNFRFTVDSSSDFDFSNEELVTTIKKRLWGPSISFDNSLSAMYYPNAATDMFKYYPGAIYRSTKTGEGNIPLDGKTKISIVYQNRSTELTNLNVAIGLVDVSKEGWKEEITEPYAAQSGGEQTVTLKSGMADNEWAHIEIDLTKFKNIDAMTISQKALSCILVELDKPGAIYVRSITLIDGDSPDGEISTSLNVNYYVGDEQQNPAYTQKVEQNMTIETVPSLGNGYKVLGYFTDAEYTTPFDFTQAITQTTDIYVQLSEQIYFDADYITNNFNMMAANGKGSSAGTVESVVEGEGSYAKMNFGYSTSSDPHALIKDSFLDISKSQKLKITFKYFGSGKGISVYFVAEDANGQPVGGTYGFDEMKRVKYDLEESEMNMSAEDEWITVELDMAKATMQNGISLWGTAKTLKMFRFQVSYTSENESDLSNEIWIKSIEGFADDTYTGVSDSETVAGLLEDDNSTETGSVAATQEQVKGWIFPKNYANAEIDGCDVYDKANGLLMYTAYGVSSTLTLKVPEGVNVSLDDFTTLALKLQNFGYATTLKVTIKNTAGDVIVRDVTIGARMGEMAEYKLNFFGTEGYSGELAEVAIAYTSVGNDNAVLFENVVFSAFESAQVAGVNFNDRNYGGAANTAQMTVAYDMAVKGTKFTVLESGANYTKTFTKFSMLGYKNIVLNYTMASAGVTAVKVGVTIDGTTDTYTYTVSASNEAQTLSLPLDRSGAIQSMSIAFEGVGEIILQSVEFTLDKANSINFNDEWLVNFLTVEAHWGKGTSYAQDLSAMQYTVSEVGGANLFKYYPGNTLASRNYGEGNIPLTGKSKIVLVYQNRSTEDTSINLGLGHTSIVEGDAWKKTVAEPSNNTTTAVLEKGMAEDEWASVEIDLTKFKDFTSQEVIDTQAAACILVRLDAVGTIYVRSISII